MAIDVIVTDCGIEVVEMTDLDTGTVEVVMEQLSLGDILIRGVRPGTRTVM